LNAVSPQIFQSVSYDKPFNASESGNNFFIIDMMSLDAEADRCFKKTERIVRACLSCSEGLVIK
jgi:hypothetical protein